MTLFPSGHRMPRVTVGLAVGLLSMLVRGQQARGQEGTVDVMERPGIAKDRPEPRDISLAEYREIKQDYIRKNERWTPGHALTYRVREPGETEPGRWRNYELTLDSFDQTHAWVAELTQYGGKFGSQDWVARYRLERSAEADSELGIPRIIEERARVVAGVRYGMSVDEVIALKGRHYRSLRVQEGGSGALVYDDVTVSFRDRWSHRNGRVVRVDATTDRTKDHMSGTRYEDEESPQTEPTVAEPVGGADPRTSGGTP